MKKKYIVLVANILPLRPYTTSHLTRYCTGDNLSDISFTILSEQVEDLEGCNHLDHKRIVGADLADPLVL